MRFHNWVRCLAATWFVFATCVVATFGQAVALQPAISSAQSSPLPEAAMVGYRTVDGWVRAWSLPAAPPDAPQLRGTGGAHVQLRLDGVLVGRGQALTRPGESGGVAVLAAVREAMRAAESRMQLPNDAMREAAIAEQASRIMISVDLAGPLIPFEPATWPEAELTLSPGLEGVAVAIRAHDGGISELAAAFPSLLISSNTLPHRALASLCAQAMGEGGAAAALDQPQQIRSRHGVRMYRFRTTHLAQCQPRAEPVFLYRGIRLIDQSEITAAELHRMAEAMASHLSVIFEADAISHPPESSALAAIALRRFAAFVPGARQPSNIHEVARRLVDTLGSSDTIDRISTAAILLAAQHVEFSKPPAEMCGNPWFDLYSRLAAKVTAGHDDCAGVLAAAPATAKGPAALAFALYPDLVRGSVNEARGDEVLSVDKALRQLMAEIPAGQLVSHMPWLGWAEIVLADQMAGMGVQPADIPSAIALREMRTKVWEHQIGAMDLDKDSLDLAGGIVFTKAASPLPTWQCARPLAFIASMLRDDRLTESQERGMELARLLQSLRFVRQLQADESAGWMASNVREAIGGVRAAPWDHSMPPDATSMSLLFLIEAIRSLDALSHPVQAPVQNGPNAPATPLKGR